ncbi:hypothetical protein V8G54_001925 [Vigna mungo]|uniref:non-specific serine/threonine protein kinase n=1 Tax=Vigna mungo TaxID=3915 RepID=A0AAQ3P766_VIGMU
MKNSNRSAYRDFEDRKSETTKSTFPTGEVVAIKRAQKESKHGTQEFKTEIELIFQVHHKNLVSFAEFCFEHEEQILVYEFVADGTLKDDLTCMHLKYIQFDRYNKY